MGMEGGGGGGSSGVEGGVEYVRLTSFFFFSFLLVWGIIRLAVGLSYPLFLGFLFFLGEDSPWELILGIEGSWYRATYLLRFRMVDGVLTYSLTFCCQKDRLCCIHPCIHLTGKGCNGMEYMNSFEHKTKFKDSRIE